MGWLTGWLTDYLADGWSRWEFYRWHIIYIQANTTSSYNDNAGNNQSSISLKLPSSPRGVPILYAEHTIWRQCFQLKLDLCMFSLFLPSFPNANTSFYIISNCVFTSYDDDKNLYYSIWSLHCYHSDLMYSLQFEWWAFEWTWWDVKVKEK